MWSFDVFDTCLVRRHAFPTDVFLDVAGLLESTLAPALGRDFARVFCEARVEAERFALERSSTEEATLEEIWRCLKELIPELDMAVGMAAELQAEQSSLIPVAACRAEIERARAEFGRVIFISDTYLPKSFIEEQLRRHGLMVDGDECFVSSAEGLTKRSGRLFSLCLQRLGIDSTSLTHHGDNLNSDVRAANGLGIRAIHLTVAALSERERNVASCLHQLDPATSSRLIGRIRAARLSATSTPANLQNSADSLVKNFIGPFLLIFAEWILKRAAEDGIQTLYFFSRDCHALHHVSRTLSGRMQVPIECRYLKVSRQALLLPAVEEISMAGMPWLHRTWEASDVGNLLAKLDLDVDVAISVMHALVGTEGQKYKIRDEEQRRKFWEYLSSEPLAGHLRQRIKDRRDAAIGYFKQEGVLSQGRIGIADLGWHQSCHDAFQRLLATDKTSSFGLRGYYLGLRSGRGKYMKQAPASAIFHQAPHDRRSVQGNASALSRAPFLEHVLNCAPHGSTHHYERVSEFGIFEAVTQAIDDNEHASKQALFNAICTFADQHAYPSHLDELETRLAMTALLNEVYENPDESWGRVLRGIQVSDDQNSRDSKSLIRPLNAFSLLKHAVKGVNPMQPDAAHLGIWPQASLAASPLWVRRGYGMLQRWKSRGG